MARSNDYLNEVDMLIARLEVEIERVERQRRILDLRTQARDDENQASTWAERGGDA